MEREFKYIKNTDPIFEMQVHLIGMSTFSIQANIKDLAESGPETWDEDDLTMFYLLDYELARRN